jgi:hypothetical protein
MVFFSGDGTFRKNPELWNTWDQMKGLQILIYVFGINLAKFSRSSFAQTSVANCASMC